METLTGSARGRKTKQKEARTETINIRCTPTELDNLKAAVEIRKKKGYVTSQADILFGGVKSYDIADKLYKLRNQICSEYNSELDYSRGFVKAEESDQFNYHRGRADALNKVLYQLDKLLSLE